MPREAGGAKKRSTTEQADRGVGPGRCLPALVESRRRSLASSPSPIGRQSPAVARPEDSDCDSGMAPLKAFLESLRDGRAIWIDGRRVEDVTEHPAFAAWARLTYGWMGRSPRYKAAVLATLGANAAYYPPYEENARRRYRAALEPVLFLNHALVHPPVDRHRPADEGRRRLDRACAIIRASGGCMHDRRQVRVRVRSSFTSIR